MPLRPIRRELIGISLAAFVGCRLLTSPTFGQAPLVLFGPGTSCDASQLARTDASFSITPTNGGPWLAVVTGHTQEWPGITLKAPGGHWDLSGYREVTVRLQNTGTNPVTVTCRVDNPGADGKDHCVSGSTEMKAGRVGELRVLMKVASDDKLNGKLFGMRGYPVAEGGPGTIAQSNVTQLLLFVTKPKENHAFLIKEIVAEGKLVRPTAWVSDANPFFPFIDTFGQYRHKDWPGKVKSEADLQTNRVREASELAEHPAPTDWDRFGGAAQGPQLRGTGFFRTEKVKGKWWLVDPDGHLFFSQGIDCVPGSDSTPVEERETWFESFPGALPEFAEFFHSGYCLKGHYAGHSPRSFSFGGANLKRKYAADWKTEYPLVIQKRLRSWGINTIANWSDDHLHVMHQTAYTDSIGSGGAQMLEGSDGYWGKFPDVFAPSFQERLQKTMEVKRGKSAGDPWCIGYFSDNEMSWGDELSLALASLKSGADQPAKKAFVGDLRAKYEDIGKLNEAWGTKHESWEALLASREAPDKDKAREDLEAFYTRFAEAYFRSVREAVKAIAPNQLYLGCRFAWVNARAAAAAARFCDVVSYNIYHRSVADFQFNGGADVPLIIGEFHLGALDRGLFHPGLVPVADQEERGRTYRDYVLGALNHPQFVGCHWFQYKDEPVTGRVYDEENYQIGFVDVADTPYPEMVAASREVAARMYRAR